MAMVCTMSLIMIFSEFRDDLVAKGDSYLVLYQSELDLSLPSYM